ncbi:magnesium transporter [Hyphomonas sp.]|jgi:magnesium transporter|uniref:magnesium transporter n=1 Tax=Hyphomonas sp. TaxID=87 RepID=UPI000C62C9EF|nr:magnesium transporter [Hyphomonas sp.]MAU65799.1 magnesium transporter [Hyphomonas sp.]MBM57619.1 magnesium transporter [Hyphomonas sp.]
MENSEAIETEQVAGTISERDIEELQDAIDDHDVRWVDRHLRRMHPADAADLLEQLSYERVQELVGILGGELPPNILIELRDEYREGAIQAMPDAAVATAIDELDSDDATTILEDLEDDRRERILVDLAPAERAQYEQGLAFEEESAGRLMQREFVAAPEYWSVGDTIDYARERGEELPETFYEIYITDPAYRPLGAVPLSQLLRTSRDTPLSAIMLPLLSNITTEMDQEEVAYQFQKYSLASAPVLDDHGRLVGMITVDDMVDVIQDENTEDFLALSGVTSADTSDSVWDSIRARSPWLVVNVCTAFAVSAVISIFEGTLNKVVALAVLMPMISALGGNAGSQTLAVAVRAIAERELEGPAVRRTVVRELLTGLGNGLMFSLVVSGIILIWFGDLLLAGVAMAAVVMTFTWTCLLGILVPLGLKKLGADPAVASSVFVLTLTDVMAFFSFLGLATLVLL